VIILIPPEIESVIAATRLESYCRNMNALQTVSALAIIGIWMGAAFLFRRIVTRHRAEEAQQAWEPIEKNLA
jgi:hypothetical protein